MSTLTNRSTRPLVLSAALAVAGLALPVHAQSLPRFVIRELPTLGGTESIGYDVNNSGLIAGTATRLNEGYHVACAWDFGPTGDHLGHYLTGSGGSVATCSAINASGMVGGISDIITLGAYLGTINGVQTTNLLGNRWGMIHRLSDSGNMVGSWFNAEGSKPFALVNGVFTSLPLLGGTQGAATGISNTGFLVGQTDDIHGGLPRPVRWTNGNVSELPGLGGWGEATAVNDSGIVAGYTSPEGSSPYIASIWLSDNRRISLGEIVPGHWLNWALDINNANQVVGVNGDLAFLWEPADGTPAGLDRGTMRNLNDLIPPSSGWTLRAANGISESGLIVGEGFHNGVMRGFLLTPRCAADFTADGAVGVGDLFAFLQAYFGADPAADVNHSGSTTVQDVFDFLSAYFAGCE